ncbi:predicted protein [Streptomyces sp. SPB78]|nr:predicted protein [Streptomyces sp. SPB78]
MRTRARPAPPGKNSARPRLWGPLKPYDRRRRPHRPPSPHRAQDALSAPHNR